MKRSPSKKTVGSSQTSSVEPTRPWGGSPTRKAWVVLSNAGAAGSQFAAWLKRQKLKTCMLLLLVFGFPAAYFAYRHQSCDQMGCLGPAPAQAPARAIYLAQQLPGANVTQLPQVLLVHTAPESAESSSYDDCADALQFPQVAMLFLTMGTIPHEATWRHWFEDARGLVPASAAVAANCSSELHSVWQQHCQVDPESDDVISQQHLFNVYVHPAPVFEGFPNSSIFYGREISTRVEAGWGSHALVVAGRELVREALKDPHNEKFILISEAGIPLYPPTTVYQTLANEEKTRVNACKHENMDMWRWHPSMGRHERRIPPRGWRKSPQWFALIRSHAELMVNDTAFDKAFSDTCHSRWDHEINRWYDCYSDEHYLPTLLAMHGKEQETYCSGNLIHVDWTKGGAHPTTYTVEDVNDESIHGMRWQSDKCDTEAALRMAPSMYVNLNDDEAWFSTCRKDLQLTARPLSPVCPMFARKFPADTAGPVEALLSKCDSPLGILQCSTAASTS